MERKLLVGRFQVRRAEVEDVSRIMSLDQQAFGDGMVLSEECFRTWLDTFPEGFQVALNAKEQIVGYGMAIRRSKEKIRHNWALDTDNGSGLTHEIGGDVLYGVSLASMAPGAGIGICMAERLLAIELGSVDFVFLYGRLPGFCAWKEQHAMVEDVDACMGRYVNLHIDRVQVFYECVGLTVARAVQGYLPEDSASLGCAVLTVWQTPRQFLTDDEA